LNCYSDESQTHDSPTETKERDHNRHLQYPYYHRQINVDKLSI